MGGGRYEEQMMGRKNEEPELVLRKCIGPLI